MLANSPKSALNQPSSTLGNGKFTVKIRTKPDSLLEESDE
jgi:hypothetical protein